jgi:hypothetical protein
MKIKNYFIGFILILCFTFMSITPFVSHLILCIFWNFVQQQPQQLQLNYHYKNDFVTEEQMVED